MNFCLSNYDRTLWTAVSWKYIGWLTMANRGGHVCAPPDKPIHIFPGILRLRKMSAVNLAFCSRWTASLNAGITHWIYDVVGGFKYNSTLWFDCDLFENEILLGYSNPSMFIPVHIIVLWHTTLHFFCSRGFLFGLGSTFALLLFWKTLLPFTSFQPKSLVNRRRAT